jgi:DNA-binding SARP family transcriptional activator/tetratricopeptide (TPR) repeat protein
VEFRVLGPVEVVLDDGPINLAAARQETVLTALLLEAGHVVSIERLIDAVWDDDPPSTARRQVQMTVSNLRRLLRELDGTGVILTQSPGYKICVTLEAFDLMRFEHLVAEAGVADPHVAVRRLRDALALWRGPAAMGIGSRLVRATATRLNEQRLAVLERCVDLQLDLGRHREVVGELTELIDEHPLRERLHAQLMIALYRSGRQADALRVFRVARNTLMNELGLEVSRELRDLERAILVADPKLNGPGKAGGSMTFTSAVATVAPYQLPLANGDLFGRDDLLFRLSQRLAPTGPEPSQYVRIVTLAGPAGIGKTAIALRVAHSLRDAFPDGQLFASLQEGDGRPRGPSALLERFLRSFGVAASKVPSELEDRAALYRSWLAGRRVVLVLDDAVSVAQVRPLLPGSPSCAVIITSRGRLAGLPGTEHVELDCLDEESGMKLLARAVGAQRTEAEPEATRELIRLCERLPLTLRIAAAKLMARPHWRIGQLVRRIRDEQRRLDELDVDGVSVRAALSCSYRILSCDHQRLLRRLGMLGAVDFGVWVAAPLMDTDVDTGADLLDVLVEAHLVEVCGSTDGHVRFHLHDLVRIYAAERLAEEEPAVERAGVFGRLLGAWLFLSAEAHRREYGGDFVLLHGLAPLWPFADDTVDDLLVDPMGWLRAEHVALVAAIHEASKAGLDEYGWDLATTAVTLFESGAYGDDWRETHEAALSAVRRAGNLRGEAALLLSLGTLALRDSIQAARGYYQRALEFFRELSDPHGQALSLSGLAFTDRLGGQYDVALCHHRAALDGFQDVGDHISEAHTLRDMAEIHMDQQRHELAQEVLDEAGAVCQKFGARRVAAQVEHQFGELYLRTGELERAEEAFESARSQTCAVGDLLGQAYAALGLGTARFMRKDHAQARIDLRWALTACEQAGDHLVRGRILFALAELDFEQGDVAAAMSGLRDARDIFGELGSAAVWRARVLALTGRLQERSGQTDAAAASWRAAEELAGGSDPALRRQLVQALLRLSKG